MQRWPPPANSRWSNQEWVSAMKVAWPIRNIGKAGQWGLRRKAVQSAICGWKAFWRNQSGQDMVEYSLLLAFVCLASAAFFIGVGRNVSGIFSFSNSSMQQAYCAASASSS
jgi:Flp pilus assembly pilin Flp